MRPGQTRRIIEDPNAVFSKRELLDVTSLSGKTFDTIRKAARVRGPGHGGLDWLFSVEDVKAIIRKAESGRFTERGGEPAAAWRALLAERGFEVEPRE